MTDKSIARHTPAPWAVIRELDEDSASETTFVTQIGPFHIEWHDDLNKGSPERIEADIALASAAPELLAALHGLLNGGYLILYASDTDEDIRLKNQARVAIFKASK